MKSRIFFNDTYKDIQLATLDLLNSQQDILSLRALRSTRAAGDAIEEIIAESFWLSFTLKRLAKFQNESVILKKYVIFGLLNQMTKAPLLWLVFDRVT